MGYACSMKKYTTVSEYLADLAPDMRDAVNTLRKIILDSADVTEHIKWNAPSYIYENEDRITFNTHSDDIKILIHMGATQKEDKKAMPILDDPVGIITWNSNIRGTVTFMDMDDVMAKKSDFIDVLKRWLVVHTQ